MERIVFADDAGSIIGEIVERYGLGKIQKKLLEKMNQMKSFPEKEKIFEELPGRQIAKIVRAVAEDLTSPRRFPYELQERLNIPLEKAQKMAIELQEKVIAHARTIDIDEIE